MIVGITEKIDLLYMVKVNLLYLTKNYVRYKSLVYNIYQLDNYSLDNDHYVHYMYKIICEISANIFNIYFDNVHRYDIGWYINRYR